METGSSGKPPKTQAANQLEKTQSPPRRVGDDFDSEDTGDTPREKLLPRPPTKPPVVKSTPQEGDEQRPQRPTGEVNVVPKPSVINAPSAAEAPQHPPAPQDGSPLTFEGASASTKMETLSAASPMTPVAPMTKAEKVNIPVHPVGPKPTPDDEKVTAGALTEGKQKSPATSAAPTTQPPAQEKVKPPRRYEGDHQAAEEEGTETESLRYETSDEEEGGAAKAKGKKESTQQPTLQPPQKREYEIVPWNCANPQPPYIATPSGAFIPRGNAEDVTSQLYHELLQVSSGNNADLISKDEFRFALRTFPTLSESEINQKMQGVEATINREGFDHAIEKEVMNFYARALRKQFLNRDPFQSGEVPSAVAAKILADSGIVQTTIAQYVTVKLQTTTQSSNTSQSHRAAATEAPGSTMVHSITRLMACLSFSANSGAPPVYVALDAGRLDLRSNDTTGEVSANGTALCVLSSPTDRFALIQTLELAAYVAKVLDQFTFDDGNCEYEPMMSFLCITTAPSSTNAPTSVIQASASDVEPTSNNRLPPANAPSKFLFAHRFVALHGRPLEHLKKARQLATIPSLLKNYDDKHLVRSIYIPRQYKDGSSFEPPPKTKNEKLVGRWITLGNVHFSADNVEAHVTESDRFVLVALIDQNNTAGAAVKVKYTMTKKDKTVWSPVDVKGEELIYVQGFENDVVCFEFCLEEKRPSTNTAAAAVDNTGAVAADETMPRPLHANSAIRCGGFATIPLTKAEEGSSAVWINNGNFYDRKKVNDAVTPSCLCGPGSPANRIDVRLNAGAPIKNTGPMGYIPDRCVIKGNHVHVVNSFRELLYLKCLEEDKDCQITLKHQQVQYALKAVEDSELVDIFCHYFNKIWSKHPAEYQKDERFRRQQFLLALSSVYCVRNSVGDMARAAKILEGAQMDADDVVKAPRRANLL